MSIAVIDVGTSSMRGILYDNSQKVITAVNKKYNSKFYSDSRVEQDSEMG